MYPATFWLSLNIPPVEEQARLERKVRETSRPPAPKHSTWHSPPRLAPTYAPLAFQTQGVAPSPPQAPT
eukprot:1000567-Pyramimonas_sp.AAC.1